MKWDLWNPWAKYYEINSTHPLIANRLDHLSKQSQILGKKPYIRFDETKPESYWDEFFVDVFIRFLPEIAFVAGLAVFYVTNNPFWIGAGLLTSGIASILKTKFSYKSDIFPDMSIASLLKKVKASNVRPVACKTKGTIIGRGVPGLIWSEDFVMQDDTGIIFLDYRQPIPLWEFFFGLLRRAKYDHQEAEVIGWYRRAPVPYIELKSIKAKGEKEKRCYTYIAKYITGGILAIIGFFLMLSPGVIPAKMPVEKSLFQAQLEFISDTFGSFQEAIRKKLQVRLPKIIKEGNFQSGEITTFDHWLEIMTKPDCFGRAVFASKFRFKGDFDIRDFESDVRSLSRNLDVSERVASDMVGIHDLRLDGSEKAATNCSEFNL